MNSLAALFIVSLTLVAAIGLVGIIYPFRPFPNRKTAAATCFLSLALIAFCSAFLPKIILPQTQVALSQETALVKGTKLAGSIPLPCGNGGLILNDIVAVSGESLLRDNPNDKADKIKNVKASEALGKDHFHQIDNSTTVRRLCAQSDWTKVQIVTPDWLNDVSGWVPSSILREIKTQEDGKRLFVTDDFIWDKDSSKFKIQIVSIINRIASENDKCTDVDTASMSLSPSKSKPNDPVFFVTCVNGGDMFNVWFKPSDAKSDKTFKATQSLDQTAAIAMCEIAAKNAAQHPSTVSFSRIWDMSYSAHSSGRSRVVSSFTAKNSFNLELKFRIDCLFDGPALIETNITESIP